MVFQADGRAVAEHPDRRQRLATDLRAQVQGGRLAPVVQALQALRGVHFTGAVTRIAARGDLSRVEHHRPRMSGLGLTPRASARGDRRRHGRLTTAGKAFARRARIAGAWASRSPGQGQPPSPLALGAAPTGHPAPRVDSPGATMHAVPSPHGTGEPGQPGGGALARDLAAFRGAIAREGPMTRSTPRPLTVHPDRIGGTRRRADERQPRVGARLGGVQRRPDTRGPRARPAPDGPTSGGTHPTATRRSTRRDDCLPLIRSSASTT
ncbi:MAG: transposase [Candidatus Entotheonellia bacterium]